MSKQIDYPADTVDASGVVWPTVGENIRNGSKELPGETQLEKIANFFTCLLGRKCDAVFLNLVSVNGNISIDNDFFTIESYDKNKWLVKYGYTLICLPIKILSTISDIKLYPNIRTDNTLALFINDETGASNFTASLIVIYYAN